MSEPLTAAVAAPAELELRPATFNDRLIAFVLDAFPFIAGYGLTLYIGVVQKHALPDSIETVKKVAAGWFGALLVYHLFGDSVGGTVGKRLMGLRVVQKDGRSIGLLRGLLRSIGYVLGTPFFNWGFAVALVHPQNRAFHDLISGSVVVEPRPKNAAESSLLFVAAVFLLAGMYGGTMYSFISAPTPADRLAVEKARDGMMVMAAIEDAYQAKNGRYTDNLGDLAVASGDADTFRLSMAQIFDPNKFRLEAGNRAYRITAFAQDRRHTQVGVEGPPAKLRP